MNRRNFIQGTAAGAGSVLVLNAIGCGGKSVSGTVAIITGAVSELQILFPNEPLLGKVVKLASDFNSDWVAGKFDSAKTFFENLDTAVTQVINDLGINASPRGKLLLATLGIAVRTIAAIINEQGAQEPKAAAVAGASAPRTVSRIKSLANPNDADWILKAVIK